MLKGNCRKKNLTTCERKISSYKPALRTHFLQNISGSCFCICDALHGLFFKGRYQSFCFIDISKHSGKFQLLTCVILKILKKFYCTKFRLSGRKIGQKLAQFKFFIFHLNYQKQRYLVIHCAKYN